ncbi:MAG: triose-phosphate isomerase, partial [Pseudomonadota bacterium]
MRRKLAAGNWKMNGLSASLAELDAIIAGIGSPDCDVLICPPATLIAAFSGTAHSKPVEIGGQTCHTAGSGAHTGEIS